MFVVVSVASICDYLTTGAIAHYVEPAIFGPYVMSRTIMAYHVMKLFYLPGCTRRDAFAHSSRHSLSSLGKTAKSVGARQGSRTSAASIQLVLIHKSVHTCFLDFLPQQS